jgi:hypothetical protein
LYSAPFYRARRFYLAVTLLAVAITVPTITYYELSYNSVNGTHPELVTGYRLITNSFAGCSATYYVTAHVWSWAGSIDTQVTSPAFALTVNNLPFGTQVESSGSFQPNNYVTYSLTFQVTDCGIANSVKSSNSSYVSLQMSADVSAGWFHELITRTDSATWTFTG